MKTTPLKYLFLVAALLGAALTNTSCGSGGSSSSSSGETGGAGGSTIPSDSSGVTSIVGLPKATDPVYPDSASSSISKSFSASKDTGGASEGMSLGEFIEDPDGYFLDAGSYTACQMTNKVTEVFSQLAQGASIFCFMQAIADQLADHGTIKRDQDANVVFTLHLLDPDADPEEQDQTVVSRLKITRVPHSSSIQNVSLHVCNPKDGGGFTQTLYLNQTVADKPTGGLFAYHMVHKNLNGSGNWIQMEVDGNLDFVQGDLPNSTTGYFIGNKTIRYKLNELSSPGGGALMYSDETVTQSSDGNVTLTGFYNGWDDAFSAPSVGSIYGKAELLDTNASNATDYQVGKLAVGNGAAKMFNYLAGGVGNYDLTQGWDGDTKGRDDAVSFYASVEDQILDTTPAAASIHGLADLQQTEIAYTTEETFSGDGSTDCVGTSVDTVTLNVTSDAAAACNTGLGSEYSRQDCFVPVCKDGVAGPGPTDTDACPGL